MWRAEKLTSGPARGNLAPMGTSTDFADCPYQALLYVVGRRGVLLIVEVPENLGWMSEGTSIGRQVRRFQIRRGSGGVHQAPARQTEHRYHPNCKRHRDKSHMNRCVAATTPCL